MTEEQAGAVLLSFDGAEEGSHHGHPDFRVKSKIFGTLWPGRDRSVLRLPLPMAEALEADRPAVFKLASRAGGAGWLGVSLSGLEECEFRDLAEEAWRFMVGGRK